MPEYIYLLENRLSSAQKQALKQVRDAAREAGMTVFLTGGAVRDLTTGSSVRNLDFAVQGNALELEAALTAGGAELWGVHEPTRTLTLWYPAGTRVDLASTRSEQYPKPGKPVYQWSTIVEDLRRRDFTANAMALSLNEGSYGLLLDPLNGVADIEARLLRLASNYGFIEDPSRLIRATRLHTRLGWQLEEKTATRYENAKEAQAIEALSPYLRGYELEKIASEEDALTTLKALEAEGWMEHMQAGWSSAKADVAGLESLRRNWIQLLMQGVTADLTVAHLELLTAKMEPQEIESLKKALVHPGLVRHWELLEESTREFAKQLTGKAAATPSSTWKLLTTHPAEPILWLAYTRKAGAVDAKFKSFFTVWPEFRKRVPTALMQEMRITPELPGYADLLEQLFFQLIDGNLATDEQMRAFLEAYSPPAPPPPPTVRRSRTKKSETKSKRRISAPDEDPDEDQDADEEDGEEEDDEDASDGEEIDEDDALSSTLSKLHGDVGEGESDDEEEGAERDRPEKDQPDEKSASRKESAFADQEEEPELPLAAPGTLAKTEAHLGQESSHTAVKAGVGHLDQPEVPAGSGRASRTAPKAAPTHGRPEADKVPETVPSAAVGAAKPKDAPAAKAASAEVPKKPISVTPARSAPASSPAAAKPGSASRTSAKAAPTKAAKPAAAKAAPAKPPLGQSAHAKAAPVKTAPSKSAPGQKSSAAGHEPPKRPAAAKKTAPASKAGKPKGAAHGKPAKRH